VIAVVYDRVGSVMWEVESSPSCLMGANQIVVLDGLKVQIM